MTDLAKALVCPKCGSHRVQPVFVAFSKSVRSGEWSSSISEFGYSLRPPGKRSVILWPLMLGGLAFVVTIGMYLNIGYITGEPRYFSDEHVRGSAFRLAEYGFYGTAVLRSAVALHFNFFKFPRLFAIWRDQAVCHRCAHMFQTTRLADFLEKTQ